ncbi:MAG: vitamin B12 dependent-methionine synthase activation domain-containing protein [Bacteroidales bacterium]
MMEVSITEIEPRDINIDLRVICGLMGIDPDDIPEPYGEIIQRELDETENYPNIKGGFRISGNIDIISPKGVFIYEGTEFGAGRQVVNNLKRSESFALYICTAGEEVSRRSKELMGQGNLLEGYVTDLVGSLLAEGAMDILHERLRSEMELKGLKVTNRYSPGYCNWNVEDQHKLFSFFPEGFCGVRLSESALMKPIKSVSGVIGIGKEVRFSKYICHACSSVNCIYRNIKYAT